MIPKTKLIILEPLKCKNINNNTTLETPYVKFEHC